MALAILLLAIAAIYLLAAAPIIGLYNDRAALLSDRRQLEPRLSGIAAELPGLRSEANRLHAAVSANHNTIEGNNDAIASAHLQNQIERLASSAGIAIGRTEAIAPQDRGSYRRVGVRITVNGEYDGIVRFLTVIEAGSPPLVISNVMIHPAGAGANARLEAGLEVYGYHLTERDSVRSDIWRANLVYS